MEWIIFLYFCDFSPLITHLLIDGFDYSPNKHFTSTKCNHWVRAVSWQLDTLGSILSSLISTQFFQALACEIQLDIVSASFYCSEGFSKITF